MLKSGAMIACENRKPFAESKLYKIEPHAFPNLFPRLLDPFCNTSL